MNYNLLLELATELGYQLAMSGAETFRVEESINWVLRAYGISSQSFALPNCLTVSIETPDGEAKTHMRRIGFHGNDLDAVEKFNALSRRICMERPAPEIAQQWLEETKAARKQYSFPVALLGNFLGASGFCLFFGGGWIDFLCAGLCGILVGCVNKFLDHMKVNNFFATIAASFASALLAYILGAVGIASHVDAVIIGTLMILVPGLLFTNAMRDIIFGDTNSGVNRIVQVLMIAAAIALGTGAAWTGIAAVCGTPEVIPVIDYGWGMELFACLIGCIGFAILFNIHGPGTLICALGGVLTWAVYLLVVELGFGEIAGYFWAALFASTFSEVMARIRKYPAISYLVVSIFPLLPGAGVYYTMNYAVKGEMELFASRGMYTAAIAGVMAVGILLASTTVRMFTTWRSRRKTK